MSPVHVLEALLSMPHTHCGTLMTTVGPAPGNLTPIEVALKREDLVDDHLMNITHVIRGSEWMPSTPKHIAMYSAFGWIPPQFAHVGLLVDEAQFFTAAQVDDLSHENDPKKK